MEYWGNIDMAKIMASNADMDTLDRQLIMAIKANDTQIVEYLILSGAYISDVYDFYDKFTHGNLEIIKLCMHGHVYSTEEYEAMLVYIVGGAAKCGHNHIIEYILDLYKTGRSNHKLIYKIYQSIISNAIIDGQLSTLIHFLEHPQSPKKKLDKLLNSILKYAQIVVEDYNILEYILDNYDIRDKVIAKLLHNTIKHVNYDTRVKCLLITHLYDGLPSV